MIAKPFKNLAIMAAFYNDIAMLLYWMRKQGGFFPAELKHVGEIFYATINVVSMMNQYHMLSCVIADDKLFEILKEIYSQENDAESIRLSFSALRHIKDESLDVKKKELRKILNTKKKR